MKRWRTIGTMMRRGLYYYGGDEMDQPGVQLRRPSTVEAVAEDLVLLSSRDDEIDEDGSHHGVGVVMMRRD